MCSSALKTLARGSALVLSLCLLIAPLCATRCTLASCLPSTAPQHSSPGCHHSAAKSSSTPTLAAIPATSCETSDSLFDTLPPQPSHSLKTISTNSAHWQPTDLNLPTASIFVAPLTIAASRLDASPGDPNSSLSAIPLRL